MRKKAYAMILAAALVTTAVFPASMQGKPVSVRAEGQGTDEYIIAAETEGAAADVEEEHANIITETFSDTSQMEEENIVVAEMTAGEAETLADDADIAYVEKDAVVYGMEEGKSELTEDNSDLQWNLDAIHLNGRRMGNGTVKVALLDSGVDYSTDIDVVSRENVLAEDDEIASMFSDGSGHGTAMAGVIAAKDNQDGITGICPGAELYSIKVLDDENRSKISVVVDGIYKAIADDCDIINMSFGTQTDSNVLHQAIRDAYDAGILLIASAGNSEGDILYPAAYEEVMAVGATDETGSVMTGMAEGAAMELYAPGTKVVATGAILGTIVTSGTSVSAAEVTGAAALVWSQDKSKSADYIRRLLANAGRTVNGTEDGAKLIDIDNAITQMDSFASVYEAGTITYPETQANAGTAERFDTEGIVNGMWLQKNHAEIAIDVAGGGTEINKLLTWGARQPDEDAYKNARMLHGAENYMLTLHYLYMATDVLRDMSQNTKNYTYKNISEAIDTAGDVGLSVFGEKQKGETVSYMDDIYKILIQNGLSEVTSDTSFSKVNAQRCYYISLGIAAHLTGDIHAHRSIVPAWTMNEKNEASIHRDDGKSKNARFGTTGFILDSTHEIAEDKVLYGWSINSKAYQADLGSKKKSGYVHKEKKICGYWRCFQQAVKIGVVEFRDIQFFACGLDKNGEKIVNNQTYEDATNFCGGRYSNARESFLSFYEAVNSGKDYDGISYMMAKKKYKLRKFKTYSSQAGEPSFANPEDSWENYSSDVEIK